MKIRFVGTCAHDYSPLLQTVYKDCLDKDARRSSCALVDGHILIDCGDHTLDSLRIQEIPQSDIDILFLTHLHGDHYNPESIRTLAAAAERKLKVYAQTGAVPELTEALEGANVQITGLPFLEKTQIGEDAYVSALPANHTRFPAHYLLEIGGKILYYATDGAWIMYDALYYLWGQNVDMIVFDATCGDYEGDFRVAEHNSIRMVRSMCRSLKKLNVYKKDAKLYLTHIAPSLHKSHEETVEKVKKSKFLVAYDGLEEEI